MQSTMLALMMLQEAKVAEADCKVAAAAEEHKELERLRKQVRQILGAGPASFEG